MTRGHGPLIGILGGMGPLATADFMAQLVRRTDAACDQDHWRSIVYSDPTIPDRSLAILNQGPSPLPGLLAGLAVLERCGVDVLAIACNTAHFWRDDLAAATRIPILGIVEAVRDALLRLDLGSGRIGILGTRGAVMSGIYQRGLGSAGFETLIPGEAEQSLLVEPAIRAVKAGEVDKAGPGLRLAIETLEARGIAAVVLGCTELPLAITTPTSRAGTPVIDSTKALADACVAFAEAFRRGHDRLGADRRRADPSRVAA